MVLGLPGNLATGYPVTFPIYGIFCAIYGIFPLFLCHSWLKSHVIFLLVICDL